MDALLCIHLEAKGWYWIASSYALYIIYFAQELTNPGAYQSSYTDQLVGCGNCLPCHSHYWITDVTDVNCHTKLSCWVLGIQTYKLILACEDLYF